MKKEFFFTLVFFLFANIICWSQSSVFVFVDVSGSGPKSSSLRNESKEIARELCFGKFDPSKYSSEWKWIGDLDPLIHSITKGNGSPLVNPKQDGYIMIMPFGLKNRYKEYKFRKITQLNQVTDFFELHYPVNYTDSFTYPEIAFASAASFAKDSSVNINSYYSIVISDGLSDTGSKPPHYTYTEDEVVANWQTSSAYPIKLGTLKYKGDSKEYKIIISRVNIQNAKIPAQSPVTVKKDLSMIKPLGSKKNPTIVRGKLINVFWKCLGCDSTSIYNVSLSYVGNNKNIRNPKPKKLKNVFKTSFSVNDNGIYRVSLSSKDLGRTSSYVKVSNSDNKAGESKGSGGLVFLLLAILGGGGYFFYKNYLHKKAANKDNGFADAKKNGKNEGGRDEFSESNDDYF